MTKPSKEPADQKPHVKAAALFVSYLKERKEPLPKGRVEALELIEAWKRDNPSIKGSTKRILGMLLTNKLVLHCHDGTLRWENKFDSVNPRDPFNMARTNGATKATEKKRKVAKHKPTGTKETVEPAVLGETSYGLNMVDDWVPQLQSWLSGEPPLLAVDCEGVNLGPREESLTLVQIGDGEQEVLIDVLDEDKSDADWNLLLQLLKCSNIVKVFFSCRNDVAAIVARWPQATFRSMVDAKFLCNNADQRLTLDTFLERNGLEHQLKDRAPHKRNPSAWQERPMPLESRQYAALDVRLLFDAVNSLFQFGAEGREVHYMGWTRANIAQGIRAAAANRSSSSSTGGQQGVLDRVRKFEASQGQVKRAHYSLTVEDARVPFMEVLPQAVQRAVAQHVKSLVDVKLIVGQPPRLYLKDETFVDVPSPAVTTEALAAIHDTIVEGTELGKLNSASRACIAGTLHRAAFARAGDGDSDDDFQFATIRFARHVAGLARVLQQHLTGSLLIVGQAGVGKTTLLRDISHFLSVDAKQNVIVIDTSNEIGGEGDQSHEAMGVACRMRVPDREDQYRRMVEALTNHTPKVLIVDEIMTKRETQAARSIHARGVHLVGTVHGKSIHDLLANPDLKGLLGGTQQVILSANERKEAGAATKTQAERVQQPVFDRILVLKSRTEWEVYEDAATAVDFHLGSSRKPMAKTVYKLTYRPSEVVVETRRLTSIYAGE